MGDDLVAHELNAFIENSMTRMRAQRRARSYA
jgi:hypothetical protein